MKYHFSSCSTIQIIYQINNKSSNYNIRRIQIYGYNKYFIYHYLYTTTRKLYIIKHIKNFILHCTYDQKLYSILSFISNLKKIGYVNIIRYIDLINTPKLYKVINFNINPILHKIIINNHQKLQIPLKKLQIILESQLGIPINYSSLCYSLENIRNWYIDKGFEWTYIRWQYSTNLLENRIKINIDEGKIYKTYLCCENLINHKILSIHIKKMNYIIIKHLNLYKNKTLNKIDLENGIRELKKIYNFHYISYNIQYSTKYKKLIIIINYKLLKIQYFSSCKLFLYNISNHRNYINIPIKALNSIYNFYKNFLIYCSQSYLTYNNIYIQLIFTHNINIFTLKCYLIYPYIYLYKNFLMRYSNEIYHKYNLNIKNHILLKNQQSNFHFKDYTSRTLLQAYLNIIYNELNSLIINQYIVHHTVKIVKKNIYIKFNHIYNHLNNLSKNNTEIGIQLLNITSYSYNFIHIYNEQIYCNIIYMFFHFAIKANYITNSNISYLHHLIYFKYTQTIVRFRFQSLSHNIKLFLNYCININNILAMPENFLQKFYSHLQIYDKRYPMNIANLMHIIELNTYSTIYYFICYIPSSIHLYYHDNLFFLHQCSLYGIGLTLNFNMIIKQIPKINLEYNINFNQDIYLHIYTHL